MEGWCWPQNVAHAASGATSLLLMAVLAGCAARGGPPPPAVGLGAPIRQALVAISGTDRHATRHPLAAWEISLAGHRLRFLSARGYAPTATHTPWRSGCAHRRDAPRGPGVTVRVGAGWSALSWDGGTILDRQGAGIARRPGDAGVPRRLWRFEFSQHARVLGAGRRRALEQRRGLPPGHRTVTGPCGARLPVTTLSRRPAYRALPSSMAWGSTRGAATDSCAAVSSL